MPKIAILIPSHRPKEYIEHCLKTIDEQTLAKDRFKVYICLNGSEPSYFDFLAKALEKHTFEYELFNLKQAGVSNARNFLIDKSSEEYICFIDDDDYISTNYLEELLEVTTAQNMGVSYSVNFTELHIFNNFVGNSFKVLKPTESNKYKSRRFYSTPWAKLLHREMIGKIRFDTNLAMGEDALFMAQISKNIAKVVKTSESACYFVNERPLSASRKSVQRLGELKRIFYLISQYIKLMLSNYNTLFVLTRIAATLKYIKRVF